MFLDIASNQSIIQAYAGLIHARIVVTDDVVGQVVMSKSRFANAVDYQCNAKTLRRGDIIGKSCVVFGAILSLERRPCRGIEVEGYVGKTQTGELSVFASKVWHICKSLRRIIIHVVHRGQVRLVAPCHADLPEVLTDQVCLDVCISETTKLSATTSPTPRTRGRAIARWSSL